MDLPALTSAVTPALRERIRSRLWDSHHLTPDVADAAVAAILAELASFVPPKRAVRNPAVHAKRREVLLEMVRAGHPLAEVARTLNVSYATVCKLMAQARADKCDLPPALPRGRRPKGVERMVEVLPLLQQGYTREEVAETLSMTLRDIDHAMNRARAQGAVVPNSYAVEKWRLELDEVTAARIQVAKALKDRQFALYAPTPDEAAAREAELNLEFEELKEKVQALEDAKPEGVSGLPDRTHRRAAALQRKENAVQRSAGLAVKTKAVAVHSVRASAVAPVPELSPADADTAKALAAKAPTLGGIIAVGMKGLSKPKAASTPSPAPAEDSQHRTPSQASAHDEAYWARHYEEAAKKREEEARKREEEQAAARRLQKARERAEEIEEELAQFDDSPEVERRVFLRYANTDVVTAALARWLDMQPHAEQLLESARENDESN